MDKVARIVSLDFHSAEAKIEYRKRRVELQSNMEEIELVISVDTADDSMISILFSLKKVPSLGPKPGA